MPRLEKLEQEFKAPTLPTLREGWDTPKFNFRAVRWKGGPPVICTRLCFRLAILWRGIFLGCGALGCRFILWRSRSCGPEERGAGFLKRIFDYLIRWRHVWASRSLNLHTRATSYAEIVQLRCQSVSSAVQKLCCRTKGIRERRRARKQRWSWPGLNFPTSLNNSTWIREGRLALGWGRAARSFALLALRSDWKRCPWPARQASLGTGGSKLPHSQMAVAIEPAKIRAWHCAAEARRLGRCRLGERFRRWPSLRVH